MWYVWWWSLTFGCLVGLRDAWVNGIGIRYRAKGLVLPSEMVTISFVKSIWIFRLCKWEDDDDWICDVSKTSCAGSGRTSEKLKNYWNIECALNLNTHQVKRGLSKMIFIVLQYSHKIKLKHILWQLVKIEAALVCKIHSWHIGSFHEILRYIVLIESKSLFMNLLNLNL